MGDIDDKDSGAVQLNRQLRNKTIDIETETKRVLTDIVRVKDATLKDKQDTIER